MKKPRSQHSGEAASATDEQGGRGERVDVLHGERLNCSVSRAAPGRCAGREARNGERPQQAVAPESLELDCGRHEGHQHGEEHAAGAESGVVLGYRDHEEGDSTSAPFSARTAMAKRLAEPERAATSRGRPAGQKARSRRALARHASPRGAARGGEQERRRVATPCPGDTQTARRVAFIATRAKVRGWKTCLARTRSVKLLGWPPRRRGIAGGGGGAEQQAGESAEIQRDRGSNRPRGQARADELDDERRARTIDTRSLA